MKVVILVDGGNVQSVYSTDKEVEVQIVDFDNFQAEGWTTEERFAFLDTSIRGMHECAVA